MKPPYAHASGTALALVAAAGTLWLAAFVVPGAGEQPAALLPAIGSAAERIVAAPEVQVTKRKPAPATRRSSAPTVVAAAPAAPAAPVRQAVQAHHHVAQAAHRAHPRHPVTVPKRSAPLTPAAAPATTSVTSPSPAAPRGRAVGWHRKHDQAAAAPAAAPERRHGKSHAKHDVAAPVAPAHDNGKHQGDDHGHGQGHDPGGKQ